ncbi:MAG: RecQ family ATP-dependent DNA helicase [Flavobacteriaceae bacterium]
MGQALDLLKRYWNFDSFRNGQQEIIDSILRGNDVLALLPTGGGKSMCYQIPGLIFSGKTLVISPLLALIEDQINQLNKREIPAISLSQGGNEADLLRILDNIQYGNYKFIFSSPEKLLNPIVYSRIKELNLSLIVFDEAHCISEWGHDFRPAYRKIGQLKSLFPKTPVLALTATATDKVVSDISKTLEIESAKLFKNSFDRKNLVYTALETFNKKHHLLRLLQKDKLGSQIIYVNSRKKSEELKDYLINSGMVAASFHGGMPRVQKQELLDSWIKGRVNIMVATNAFGMGIDKDDVNRVIHFDVPFSVENYVQEAGRAGRQGQESESIILFNQDNLDKFYAKNIINAVDINFIKFVYDKLNQFFNISIGELIESELSLELKTFSQRYKLSSYKTFQALKLLEAVGLMELKERFQQKISIQFRINPYQFDSSFEKHKDLKPIAEFLIRNNGAIYDQIIDIPLDYISKGIKLSIRDVLVRLEKMQALSLVDFQLIKADLTVRILEPREGNKTINRYAKSLEKIILHKKQKSKDIWSYLTHKDRCRKLMILSYFQETKHSPCGQCDNCLRGKKIDLTEFKQLIVSFLEQNENQSIEMINMNLKIETEVLINCMNELLEENVITQDKLFNFNTVKK